MEQKEIIKINKRKDKWDSDELIKLIKSEDKKQIKIKEYQPLSGVPDSPTKRLILELLSKKS